MKPQPSSVLIVDDNEDIRSLLADQIQVAPATYERLQYHYEFRERGCIPVKGKGEVKPYLLAGRKTCNLNGRGSGMAVMAVKS